MDTNDAWPVTSLPFEVRLGRAEFDLATVAILSVVTARNRVVTFLSMIVGRRLPGENPTPTDTELTVLFNDAWTIIDRLDMLRRLLLPQLVKAPINTNASELLLALQDIRAVRNRMDHVDAKLIARKTSSPDFPILGVITAAMPDASQLDNGTLTHIDHIVLSHSEFHAKLNLRTVPEDVFPITPPVDHIRLHAFGMVINLSRVVALAEGITDVMKHREQLPPGPHNRLSVVIRQNFDPPVAVSKLGKG